MDKEKIIELLNYDISHEIEAILTYLRHSFVLHDDYCKLSRRAEEIARDEMRHMEWLSEWVVDLGGTPTVEHVELIFSEKTPAEMMLRNVELEKQAISDYQKHIEMVEDPNLKRLLGKIKFEEEDHLEEFRKSMEEALAAEKSEAEPPSENTEKAESEPAKEEAEPQKEVGGLTVGSLKQG
ncbi:ferritin-like domain-containing protein [Candidatus Poribacteria bacterium]|nr:ferritin-like domain-containing protein [Candidatus Poribacteria bacterium]